MVDTPDKSDEAVANLANITIDAQRLDVYAVRHTVFDMTPKAAEAMVRIEEAKRDAAIAQARATEMVAKAEHEVPAKQATMRQLITGVVVLGGIVACCLVPPAAPYIGGVVLVLGGAEITRTIVGRRETKKKDDE